MNLLSREIIFIDFYYRCDWFHVHLPPVVFGFVLPVRMELSHILLLDEIVILLVDFLAFHVVIDSARSVALDDVLPKQPNCLVGDLPLSGTLFSGQQELDGVLGASSLYT